VVFRRRTRRWLGAILIVVGVGLMLLAHESEIGWLLLGLALALEIIGLALERGR
jgi:drug/metabolite transporter (DMT)-like permease